MAKRKDQPTTDLGELNMTAAPVEASYADSFSAPVGNAHGGFGFFQDSGRDIPGYATEFSAGMDIAADFMPGQPIMAFDRSNQKLDKKARDVEGRTRIYLEPGERALIPTGLFADIPEGFYLAIHSRSGLSFKQGLILTNGVAVIDADYVEEIFVSLTNNTGTRVVIEDGDRIAQFVLMPVVKPLTGWKVLDKKPNQKTSRAGGFGSTGVK